MRGGQLSGGGACHSLIAQCSIIGRTGSAVTSTMYASALFDVLISTPASYLHMSLRAD